MGCYAGCGTRSVKSPREDPEQWHLYAEWFISHTRPTLEPCFKLWLTLTKQPSRLEAGAQRWSVATSCHADSRSAAFMVSLQSRVAEAVHEWAISLPTSGPESPPLSPSKPTTTQSTR